MPAPHFQALYDHYPAVIRMMPTARAFSSHEFILRLFQQHQREFIAALHEYRDGGAPMRQVTSQLSRQLYQFSHLATNDGEDPRSADIFGDVSSCAVWRRTS